MSQFKERAENVTDLLLDFVRKYPSSWVILLAYSAVVFGLGAWAGWSLGHP